MTHKQNLICSRVQCLTGKCFYYKRPEKESWESMRRYPVIKRERILPSAGSYKSDYPFIKVHLWQSDSNDVCSLKGLCREPRSHINMTLPSWSHCDSISLWPTGMSGMFQANATCVLLHLTNHHGFNQTENFVLKLLEVKRLASMESQLPLMWHTYCRIGNKTALNLHFERTNGKPHTIWYQTNQQQLYAI